MNIFKARVIVYLLLLKPEKTIKLRPLIYSLTRHPILPNNTSFYVRNSLNISQYLLEFLLISTKPTITLRLRLIVVVIFLMSFLYLFGTILTTLCDFPLSDMISISTRLPKCLFEECYIHWGWIRARKLSIRTWSLKID